MRSARYRRNMKRESIGDILDRECQRKQWMPNRLARAEQPVCQWQLAVAEREGKTEQNQRADIAPAEAVSFAVATNECEQCASGAGIVAVCHWHEQRCGKAGNGDRDRNNPCGANEVSVEGFEMGEVDRKAEDRHRQHDTEQRGTDPAECSIHVRTNTNSPLSWSHAMQEF